MYSYGNCKTILYSCKLSMIKQSTNRLLLHYNEYKNVMQDNYFSCKYQPKKKASKSKNLEAS